MQVALGGAMATAISGTGCHPPPIRMNPELLGFNLITWDRRALTNAEPWKTAIRSMRDVGVSRVTIVPYQLLNKTTLRLDRSSQYQLVSGPGLDLVAEIIQHAREHGLSVGVKPMIEIDNEKGEGVIWRGSLHIASHDIGTFFQSYTGYVLDALRTAKSQGADRFYIGSELRSLVRNAETHPYWSQLIEACRQELGTSGCILSYAANFDEYQYVPFWRDLDEIGIDAYFPLARHDEALGPGRPGIDDLHRRLAKIMADLRAFSRRHDRPVMLAEWGVVPFDLTTIEPSNDQPSSRPDPEEALNAYSALIAAVGQQGDWLKGVDFWHWGVSTQQDSNYSITAASPVAELLRNTVLS